MKEEYKCPIDGCDSSFFTEVGLNFHVKSKHGNQPKVEAKPQVQKMTPVASKPAPQKAVAPAPKVETKPVETFKPKTESSSKKGIDAALDGLE